MSSSRHLNFPKAGSLILLTLLIAIMPSLVRGDDLTGLSQDDPKDLMPAPDISSPPLRPTGEIIFQRLPEWARVGSMVAMPDKLKPLGKSPYVAATPAPAPLAPPPEAHPVVSTPAPVVAQAKPAAPPAETPALIAVSPFLQWIKANPQAAAVEARQQANAYHAPAPSDSAAANGAGNPSGSTPAAPGNPGDSYWLPPLIDSPNFGSGAVGGSSAAIYSTPQR